MYYVHQTRCGKCIPLTKLTNTHLANILNYLRNKPNKLKPYLEEYARRNSVQGYDLDCPEWLERGEDLLLDYESKSKRKAFVSVINKLL